jgi:hypothetical protein
LRAEECYYEHDDGDEERGRRWNALMAWIEWEWGRTHNWWRTPKKERKSHGTTE